MPHAASELSAVVYFVVCVHLPSSLRSEPNRNKGITSSQDSLFCERPKNGYTAGLGLQVTGFRDMYRRDGRLVLKPRNSLLMPCVEDIPSGDGPVGGLSIQPGIYEKRRDRDKPKTVPAIRRGSARNAVNLTEIRVNRDRAAEKSLRYYYKFGKASTILPYII